MVCLLASVLLSSSLTLPAFTAYPAPNPDGAQVEDDGSIGGWSSDRTRIEWGGYFAHPGTVHAVAQIELPAGAAASYRLTSGSDRHEGVARDGTVDLGTFSIAKPGWRTFWLQGVRRSGADFGKLESLRLEGDAVDGAKFNLKPRRNAASVHLGFPIGKDDRIEWFYNEVTAKEDPVDTYYEACGFARGYFGMQVNGPHERRIIFSIWDSGKEAIDRSKVGTENRVRLLAKGPGVYAGDFGNEGTGGHSHLVYHWKTGVPQKFLVHAVPQGNDTVYTAYFYMPPLKRWQLIASFEAPNDGSYLHGLYSFVEDFNGDNGNLKRKALYGPVWVRTADGRWKHLVTARFTHDATGGKDRFDYDFGADGSRFYLQNGGFEGRSPVLGSTVTLSNPAGSPPQIDLDALR